MDKMNNILFGLVLIFILAFVTGNEINFKDCGSTIGKVTAVLVKGCDKTMTRCPLKRKENSTVEIHFNANEHSDVLTAVVHGILMDIPVPFALPNENGCLDSGIECPLEAGKIYGYSASLPILSKYPRVTVDVKWELRSANEKDYVCVIIPAKIQ